MKLNERDTLPPEAVERVDPTRVQEYLRAGGWVVEPRLGGGKSAVYERPESWLEQIGVPLNRDARTFTLNMASAIALLAQWEKRPAIEVLGDLLLAPSDIVKFAESSQAAHGGDVPFEHGLTLLRGVRKVLLAAACSTIRPRLCHSRRNLAEAEPFVRQCRLGQTERCSFTVTIACPLEVVLPETDLSNRAPLGRRVTALLMRSLDRLVRHFDLGDADGLLQQAEDEPIISANLCEALLDLAPEGEGGSLRISARWCRTLPLGEETLPTTVRFRQEFFRRIEYLAGRLRPALTARRQVFVGVVEALNGQPNEEHRPDGQVVLRVVTPDDENLRVRAKLTADDYALANRAHMQNMPFHLEGVLRQIGHMYCIDEISDFAVLPVSETAVAGD
jgi:hypothetical protein